MVAVAPPRLCGVSSAAAVPAVASAPAATRPDTNVAAVRRAVTRLRANDAENERNTEFPFAQDPLMWGKVPPAESEAP
ncbi:hypothetical protein GCM10023335_08960 [Streptomyces siamensis]|uniref:Uncharacterized protein n=1 Tax=Streptomyces siamensis TaxID=1274986 RepID=A0ABP9IHA4_9ACTN